jgi:hypothetical protein
MLEHLTMFKCIQQHKGVELTPVRVTNFVTPSVWGLVVTCWVGPLHPPVLQDVSIKFRGWSSLTISYFGRCYQRHFETSIFLSHWTVVLLLHSVQSNSFCTHHICHYYCPISDRYVPAHCTAVTFCSVKQFLHTPHLPLLLSYIWPLPSSPLCCCYILFSQSVFSHTTSATSYCPISDRYLPNS